MSFGENLISLRKLNGLGRKELADKLDIPYTTLRNYETNQREPGHKLLIKIAQLFSVSVDSLIGVPSSKKEPLYSSDAMEIARVYDSLDDDGKNSLQDALKKELRRMEREANLREAALLDRSAAEDEALRRLVASFAPLKIYGTPITDSVGIDLTVEPETKMIQITNRTSMETVFALKQTPQSKNPFGVYFRYDDGKETILAIDGGKVVESGQAGIFVIDGKGFLKKLKNNRLYPVQDEYDSIPLSDEIQCAGCAIGRIENVLINDIRGNF